jgi:hypothetical protein
MGCATIPVLKNSSTLKLPSIWVSAPAARASSIAENHVAVVVATVMAARRDTTNDNANTQP